MAVSLKQNETLSAMAHSLIAIRLALATLVLSTSATPSRVAAQSSAQLPDAALSQRTCFRGRPKPTCDRFWLTEFGIAAPVPSGTNRVRLSLEVGVMRNVAKKHAVGLAAFAEGSEFDGGLGVRPRYRYWMRPDVSLDVAPGLAYSTGLSGQIALNFADHAAVSLQVARLRQRYGLGPDRPKVLVGRK